MTEREENPPPNNLWEWLLSNASKLRDLALAGAAVTYTIGFIVWAIHASINDLGLLPVLDSQYIIAGLVPTILIAIGVATVYFVLRGIHISPRLQWAANVYRKLLVAISIIGVFIFALDALLSSVGFPLNVVDRSVDYVDHFSASFTIWELAGILLLIYIVSTLFMILTAGERPSETNSFVLLFGRLFGIPILIFMNVFLYTFFYVVFVYPNTPYSLGGAEPRCAYLDIDISKISADSRSSLFSADRDTSTTRRSDALDVYYAGDNWVLVKKAPTDRRDPNAACRRVQLDRV